MPDLTRKQFVKICTQAIFNTRSKITINNQKSGYQKFHWEIKENDYFYAKARPALKGNKDPVFLHDAIEHIGLGNCNELADYLLVEIGKEINNFNNSNNNNNNNNDNAIAKMSIIRSKKVDHVYVEIFIQLADEKHPSLWEVDAWDPRIIDVSRRPDGSIKNVEALDYGYEVKVRASFSSDKIDYHKEYSFFNVSKPKPGCSTGNCTPEREILRKHRDLYSDYTIEEAVKKKKLDPDGEIHYLQKASDWQCKKS
ncbi:hypothetical protein ACNVED_12930 [Legionella sp. D16C41]|uniref:hypothetical protein n=1 Tax=Legionella sp. D16C41 TaxID=3402688 RepID=UPI003AF7FFA3